MSDERPSRAEKLKLFEQGFDLVAFKDLPPEHQMAMAWYMAVDGEAWDDVIDWDSIKFPKGIGNSDDPRWHETRKQVVADNMQSFIEKYGDREFGIATWPAKDLVTSVAGDDFAKEEGYSFDRLWANYQKPVENYFVTSHPKDRLWPVIMSNHDDETLQDGWHRFHLYVANGHEDIPVIFYPEAWHYELKAQLNGPRP